MKTMVANISEQIDWSDLRIVLAVARSESIKGAAKHLRMTDATISRHISSVEECLGIHLFERMSTGMRITPACRELIEHVSRAESALESGIEAATGHLDKPSGNIRLTTVPTVMNHIIVPAVDNFLMQYPEISLSLVGLPTNLSMMRRETDIALRLSLPKSDLLAISRSIGYLEYGVFVNKNIDNAQNSFADTPWITYESDMSDLPQAKWVSNHIEQSGEPVYRLCCNDADGLISAVNEGFGKALLPRKIANNRHDFKEISGYKNLPKRDLWVLIHPNLAMTKRTRIVIDWLASIFA